MIAFGAHRHRPCRGGELDGRPPRLTEADRPLPRRRARRTTRWRHQSVLARNPLLLAVITVLFGLIDFAYIGMYATFLREHLGFSAGQAGLAVSLSGLAAFASPLGGWLVDRLDPRRVLAGLNLAQAIAGMPRCSLGPATPVVAVGLVVPVRAVRQQRALRRARRLDGQVACTEDHRRARARECSSPASMSPRRSRACSTAGWSTRLVDGRGPGRRSAGFSLVCVAARAARCDAAQFSTIVMSTER